MQVGPRTLAPFSGARLWCSRILAPQSGTPLWRRTRRPRTLAPLAGAPQSAPLWRPAPQSAPWRGERGARTATQSRASHPGAPLWRLWPAPQSRASHPGAPLYRTTVGPSLWRENVVQVLPRHSLGGGACVAVAPDQQACTPSLFRLLRYSRYRS